MLRRKRYITLEETIEALKNEKKRSKNKEAAEYSLLFFFIVIALLLPRYRLCIEGTICFISLIQCVCCGMRATKKKGNTKQNAIRTLPWVILIIYFALIGTVFTVYGCIYYVLRIQIHRFMILDWIEKSAAIFLLFEIIAIQLNRKRG